MTTLQIVLTIISAFLGGGLFGGAGQYIRARGQNRTDEYIALANEQQQLRLARASDLAELRTEIKYLKDANAAMDVRNDQLVKENAELTGRVRFLEEQNADLKHRVMNEQSEKEGMKREIAQLQAQIAGLDRRQAEGVA